MVLKVKENFEKARNDENIDKYKEYTLRGERKIRFFDRIPPSQKKNNFLGE